jgi:hypothetical protein
MTCLTDGRAGKVCNSHVRWLPVFFLYAVRFHAHMKENAQVHHL